jgi:hypothetical protein
VGALNRALASFLKGLFMSNGDYSKAHRNLYRTDVGSNRPTRRDPFCRYIDDERGTIGGSVATFPATPVAPEAKPEGGILPFGRIGRRSKNGGLAPKPVKCAVCFKEFTSSQPHAKTCSTRSRQKLCRLRKLEKKQDGAITAYR